MTDKVTMEDLLAQQAVAHEACTKAIRGLMELRQRMASPLLDRRRRNQNDLDEVHGRITVGPKTLGQIAAELKIPKSRAQRIMNQLVKTGQARLHRDGRGFEASDGHR
jgi:hypothetical protein